MSKPFCWSSSANFSKLGLLQTRSLDRQLLSGRRPRAQEIHICARCEKKEMASQTVPNGTEGYWPEPGDVACSDPSRSLAAGAPIVSPPSGWPACFKENAVMKAFVRAPIGVPRTTRRRRARAQTPFPSWHRQPCCPRPRPLPLSPPCRRAAVPPCRRAAVPPPVLTHVASRRAHSPRSSARSSLRASAAA